jgi:hypothetical protein
MELNLFGRVGQVSLHKRIIQQLCETPQNKVEVFISVNPWQIIDEQIVWYRYLKKQILLMKYNLKPKHVFF